MNQNEGDTQATQIDNDLTKEKQLLEASKTGDLNLIKKLLDEGANINTSSDC